MRHIPKRGTSPTNYNGDLHRKRLLAWVQDEHWFTINEAAKHLKIKPYLTRRYVYELRNKGLLTERRRAQDLPSQPPIEYQYKDNWHVLAESTDPLVTRYYMDLKILARVYKEGLIPKDTSIDAVLTDMGDEIERLEKTVALLKMMYDNPDLRRVNSFVKRMR